MKDGFTDQPQEAVNACPKLGDIDDGLCAVVKK